MAGMIVPLTHTLRKVMRICLINLKVFSISFNNLLYKEGLLAFESSSQVVKMSKRIFRLAKALVYSLVGAVDPRLVIKLCVEI